MANNICRNSQPSGGSVLPESEMVHINSIGLAAAPHRNCPIAAKRRHFRLRNPSDCPETTMLFDRASAVRRLLHFSMVSPFFLVGRFSWFAAR
jgi:hypothetical protein